MPRQIREVRLQTRDSRRQLAPQKEPYWKELRRGLHVGYYKGSTAGTWWLREYRAGKRPKRRLGVADDDVEADGVTVFSWPQVLVAALGGDRPTLATSSSFTVNDALADYWLYRAAKSPALSVEIDKSKAKAHLDEAMRVRPVVELKTPISSAGSTGWSPQPKIAKRSGAPRRPPKRCDGSSLPRSIMPTAADARTCRPRMHGEPCAASGT